VSAKLYRASVGFSFMQRSSFGAFAKYRFVLFIGSAPSIGTRNLWYVSKQNIAIDKTTKNMEMTANA
jgi:hypothetical protein